MTEVKTQPSVTKELLELTQKEFPNLPAHMIKLMYDFDKSNPTWLQDNKEIMDKPFTPKAFSKVIDDAVSIKKPDELEYAPPIEGLTMEPINKLTEEEYNEQAKAMKADQLKFDMEAEE